MVRYPKALEKWQRKLGALLEAEPLENDPATKFRLKEQIAEARSKIAELEDTHQPATQHIAPSRLPAGARDLFGREAELAALDRAWAEGKLHVVSLVAWGGTGKTSLVVEWQGRLAARDFDGAHYFDWSFYSQGTREDGAASAEPFVNAALRHFGDPELAASGASGWDKGARLAQLVAARRCLLVLDGLEPLQHPEGPQGGELKDPAVRSLLRGLALRNPGLCVLTTRETVTDLEPYHGKTVEEWELARLPKTAGVALLRKLGVRGPVAELEKLVDDVQGHALTLSILGRYLGLAHGGDVRRWDLVDLEEADAKTKHGHAFKAVKAYATWLAGSGEAGQRQLAILRLLGLFDRPASFGCIEALRKAPGIEGLTEALLGVSEATWNEALSHLRAADLVTVKGERQGEGPLWGEGANLDAHPLLREYFAKELRTHHEAAWKAAHSRLYEHLRDKTEHQPATLEGLQPLYQAVLHGCHAGRQQDACDEVYRDRILRGTGDGGFYSTKQLGAFGVDLGAVACFFEQRWTRLSPAVTEAAQAWLLHEAATRLRGLGRLREALELMRAAESLYTQLEDRKNAAVGASNLSGLAETLGALEEAEAAAERSVTYADRVGDLFLRMAFRTTMAYARFQSGREAEAGELFREAEVLQQEWQPQFPRLYSVQGFQYCELLSAGAERGSWGRVGEETRTRLLAACGEVEGRAIEMLKGVDASDSMLSIALYHLALGRVHLYRALLTGGDPAESAPEIAAAVDGLRRAGTTHHLPRGLLTRARLLWHLGDTKGAHADLDETWEIASLGPMPLFLADVCLFRSRLFQDYEALREARRLIGRYKYDRRLPELADAEMALGA